MNQKKIYDFFQPKSCMIHSFVDHAFWVHIMYQEYWIRNFFDLKELKVQCRKYYINTNIFLHEILSSHYGSETYQITRNIIMMTVLFLSSGDSVQGGISFPQTVVAPRVKNAHGVMKAYRWALNWAGTRDEEEVQEDFFLEKVTP